MILDEIYKRIKEVRERGGSCPFPKEDNWKNCNKCRLLFPEIDGFLFTGKWHCPCAVLGDYYVKSETRRLFP